MSIEKKTVGRLAGGGVVTSYVLRNKNGMEAVIMTYGCRLARLYVPDRYGKPENVVLGHRTLSEYEKGEDVFGAVIGRFANRIAKAEVEVGGAVYRMNKNDGENSLHSAPGGYQSKNWRAVSREESCGSQEVTFYYFDRGESRLPGCVKVYVTYRLTDGNELSISYEAETDAETPFNPTNHSYFNITGSEGKSICPLEAKIYADYITEAGSGLIPTGKLMPVGGTPYDFSTYKAIGGGISADEYLLKACGGYDVNYVLKGTYGRVRKAAEIADKESGRVLQVFTDMPGMQLYTANSFPAGTLGVGGKPLKPHCAVCLETQFFPDSVHHPSFPYENLKPGNRFRSETVYRFSAV